MSVRILCPPETRSGSRDWHRLFGKEIGEREATVYGRTVEAGGCVLSVRLPESDVPRAMGILNAHNVVDVENRAAEHGLIERPATGAAPPPRPAVTTAGVTPTKPAVVTPMAKEEVMRLAEEQLVVGKRLVQEGTARIRRFVTERPVEQQVTFGIRPQVQQIEIEHEATPVEEEKLRKAG